MKKKINKPHTKKFQYNLLDVAYFAQQEVLDLQKLLTEAGLAIEMTPEVLNAAMENNNYLESALENKIENLCTILQVYNKQLSSSYTLSKRHKEYLVNKYDLVLSIDASTFLLNSSRNRISIAHRQDVLKQESLFSRIMFANEIQSAYLVYIIKDLKDICKFEFNHYIKEHIKIISSVPVPSALSNKLISPSPENVVPGPLSSSPSTSTFDHKSTSSSKRSSNTGVQGFQEFSSFSSAKKPRTKPESPFSSTDTEPTVTSNTSAFNTPSSNAMGDSQESSEPANLPLNEGNPRDDSQTQEPDNNPRTSPPHHSHKKSR
jgi:hypothetical protein